MMKRELTYFTATEVSPGALVKIPIRSKTILGVVVTVEDARLHKTTLRSQAFPIRKITATGERFFENSFLEAVHTLAQEHGATPGAILTSFLPRTFDIRHPSLDIPTNHRKDAFRETTILGNTKERAKKYQTLIKKSHRAHTSVLLLTPTQQHAEMWGKKFTSNCVVLHGGLTVRETRARLSRTMESKTPLTIIVTGSFLGIPRNDIGTIVIESEHDDRYKLPYRPHIDMRTAALVYAKKRSALLVYGDRFLRFETHVRLHTPIPKSKLGTPFRIIDLREKKKDEEKTPFTALSHEAVATLREAQRSNKRVFVFVPRRGYAPMTTCRDCGTLVACPHCTTPLVLHISSKRTYLCHHCGKRTPPPNRCVTCGGWRLEAIGVGIERVCSELEEHFPSTTQIRLDADSVEKESALRARIEAWKGTPRSILIGTHKALPYLDEISYTIVVSLDSLLSLPDFRTSERVFHTILSLQEKTTKALLIQTRNPDQPLIAALKEENIPKFYKEEIAARKMLMYPPFSRLIKITTRGSDQAILSAKTLLENTFRAFSPEIFAGFVPSARGKKILHALIKTEKEAPLDPTLLKKLETLPPPYAIDIDPISLL